MSKSNQYIVESHGNNNPEKVEEKPTSVEVVVTDAKEQIATPVETKKKEPPVAVPVETLKPKQGAVRVSSKQPEKPVNRRVQTFEYQVTQYISLCNTSISTEKSMKKKLYQFANIIRMIINSTDTAVFDAAYEFFKKYRNSILSEEKVFGYIHAIPTAQSIRMQTIYTTFREMVEANINRTKFALDYGLIRDNLKLPVQHPLLNWIRKKMINN